MSAADARKAVEAFFDGFNARDQEAVRAALNYPHVRLASRRVLITETASDFAIPYDRLIAAESWHHSTLDRCDVVQEGPDKVHFDVRFRRYLEDGTCYATHQSLWIVTRLDDHWGVQARSSYAP